MFSHRIATVADLEALLPRVQAFFAVEEIAFDEGTVRPAMARLLGDRELGAVLILELHGAIVGYVTATWGFDVEFGGRDGYLTDLWLDPSARGRGYGKLALQAAERVAKEHGVQQLHLLVRPENHTALRMYVHAGYARPPRLFFSKRI